jgi:acyl-CoA reductase-like NAD-dependent aldehyde dehydrogenase
VRAARAAFDDGRWRNLEPLEKDAACAARRADRRQPRPPDGPGRRRWRLVRAYSEFIVKFGQDAVAYYSGWPTKLHGRCPPARPMSWSARSASRSAVCAVITPWNGPSAAPAGIVPALACGNSVC